MQGEPIDHKNNFVTLVDSVALPLVEQFDSPLYLPTDSSEQFVFINELRLGQFMYLSFRLVLRKKKKKVNFESLCND